MISVIFQTKVVGTFNVIRLSAELIGKNEPDNDGLRGVIINTSGVEATKGALGQTATAAASGAINSMTRPLAVDFSERGIRVVTIAPGLMKTPLLDQISSDIVESLSQECVTAPKRFGEPDEFAHLVQSIISNPYINGTTIELSGGLRLTI